ncbi:hypothetical protein ES288_D13G163700v1 [Gossypium darwinii]|uniref:Secreted protein n=1 Tax=Gossypium darwinii TaxID=34276 RepID=A0A5D2A1E0_GOSDA|nr:hypothetical protein ES288_D13G163700v1 [Gossypium darwinii]
MFPFFFFFFLCSGPVSSFVLCFLCFAFLCPSRVIILKVECCYYHKHDHLIHNCPVQPLRTGETTKAGGSPNFKGVFPVTSSSIAAAFMRKSTCILTKGTLHLASISSSA